MTMLEHTDNDSLQADDENVSKQTSKLAPEKETVASEPVEDTPNLVDKTINQKKKALLTQAKKKA